MPNLTISEAATLLGCHPNTLRNHIKRGTIKATKVLTKHGETWEIPEEELAKLGYTPPQETLLNPDIQDGTDDVNPPGANLPAQVEALVSPWAALVKDLQAQVTAYAEENGALRAQLEMLKPPQKKRRKWWPLW